MQLRQQLMDLRDDVKIFMDSLKKRQHTEQKKLTAQTLSAWLAGCLAGWQPANHKPSARGARGRQVSLRACTQPASSNQAQGRILSFFLSLHSCLRAAVMRSLNVQKGSTLSRPPLCRPRGAGAAEAASLQPGGKRGTGQPAGVHTATPATTSRMAAAGCVAPPPVRQWVLRNNCRNISA